MNRTLWSVRFRVGILVGWAILLGVATPFAVHVTHHLSSQGFSAPGSSSVWAENEQAKIVSPPSASPELIQGLSSSSIVTLARRADLPLTWIHQVRADGSLLYPPSGTPKGRVRGFLSDVKAAGGRVVAVSDASVGHEISSDTVQTLRMSSAFALPVLALLLLLVFGSVASAALPLVIALVGSVLALAAVDLLEDVVTLSTYLTDIVTFLALGVGVDYALFISTRFRQAMRGGRPVPKAVQEAMGSAGRSVFFSGLAVALAMASLLLGGTTYWRGLALGGAVAVAAVLLATHTLLPALLASMGRRVNWGTLPPIVAFRNFWPTLSRLGTRFPAVAIVAGGLILLVPALFGPQIEMSIPGDLSAMLPTSSPLRQATAVERRLEGAGVLSPFLVVTRYPTTLKDPTTWSDVAKLTKTVEKLEDVASVESPSSLGLPPQTLASLFQTPSRAPIELSRALSAFTSPAKDDHLVVLYVTAKTGPDTGASSALLGRLRQTVEHLTPRGGRSGVGGAVALLHDFDHYVALRMPWIIGAVALVAFSVLFAATGALWQALLGVVMDGLVALATAGLLVLTIQRGGLGFPPSPLNTGVTPLIFVLLFGLSMDYEVILLHRIQEAFGGGADTREAARQGIEITGGMITGAGIIMVVVFVALVLSPLEILQTLGVGMTVAILLDTWIVRTFLVPGSTTLLGRFAFWPRQPGVRQRSSTP